LQDQILQTFFSKNRLTFFRIDFFTVRLELIEVKVTMESGITKSLTRKRSGLYKIRSSY